MKIEEVKLRQRVRVTMPPPEKNGWMDGSVIALSTLTGMVLVREDADMQEWWRPASDCEALS